jgi:hypothetical protein
MSAVDGLCERVSHDLSSIPVGREARVLVPVITDNESDHNGMPLYLLPGVTGTSKVVQRIMIHQDVTSAVIQGNNVHDQPNGAGIAVFDSRNSVIRSNVVRNRTARTRQPSICTRVPGQWWAPCRPRVSTGPAPGRVRCGTGRLVWPQVGSPSASERQYRQA